MKTCSRCNEEKELSEFRKRTKSPDGFSVWCRQCFAKYEHDRYQNGDRARKEKNKANTVDKNRKSLWDYLSTHPCVDCGNSDPRVLEFDHRDELTKSHNVTELWNYSWSRIMDEISKCDVRCANCHRIRTQEQFGTWRFNFGM